VIEASTRVIMQM